MFQGSIQLASADDLPLINDIYNHYVLHSTCTYQEEPETLPARLAWFEKRSVREPVTVAVRDGQVVGWGALKLYHARSAYRFTAENSVYVRHDLHRQGIGAALLADLLQRAQLTGYHSIIAGIDSEQQPSIALHERFGFVKVAHLKQVGFKFNRWLDVVYLQWTVA